MTKSARLTCPDCECPAVWREGRRHCPQCGDALVIDAETFDTDTDPGRPGWAYTQKRGADRGGVVWGR